MWTAREYNLLIDTLGVPASLVYTKAPAQTLSGLKVGFATVTKEDATIINSYGIGAKVITFKAADVTARPPVKFDVVQIGSEKYTIDTVNPAHLPGTGAIVGYKCYIRGHN